MFPLPTAVKKVGLQHVARKTWENEPKVTALQLSLKYGLMVFLATHLIPFSKGEPISLVK